MKYFNKKIEDKQKDEFNIIEERTKKIFERLECFKSNGNIDITKLAYLFNFEIVENNELPDLINGMITCDLNGNQMVINNNLSKESKRYSIAYLLSIYLLYYQNEDLFIYKHLEFDEKIDASMMARKLLIPNISESILKRMYSNYMNNIKELSEMFEVPYNVMEQRIKEIRKYDDALYEMSNNFILSEMDDSTILEMAKLYTPKAKVKRIIKRK